MPSNLHFDGRIGVTVIVPCFNTAQYLDQCLTSIEADDFALLEVIVLNDGSTDNSLEIMRRHEEIDSRIRVIDKPNQGYGATVNRGIEESRGAYIAIVEPDDYLKPGMYTRLMDLAHAYGEPDVVKSAYWRVCMPGTPQENVCHCAYYKRINTKKQPFTLRDNPRLIQHHPSIWSAIYKRSFLDEFGIRFKEVPGAGWVDNPFLIQTLAQARSIVYTDDSFYCYREDLPTSSSAKKASDLPIVRWNDMADIVDELNIYDKGILESFYTIGFRYVGGLVEQGAFEDPALKARCAALFKRMNPEIVSGMSHISGAFKQTYSQLTGVVVSANKVAYVAYLASEFVYSLRTNGFGFAFSRIGLFGNRRAAEKGERRDKTSA